MNRYTPQEAATVAGLRASGLTHAEIAERTGIPRRSVTNILGRTPVAEIVTSATVDQVSRALWEVVAAGTTEALRRIADPKTKAGELAQIIRVAAEQHALLNGGVTARTETLTPEQTAARYQEQYDLGQWLDMMDSFSDDELRSYMAKHGVERLVDMTHSQSDEP